MTRDDVPVYRASVRGRRDVTPRLVSVTLGDVIGPGGAAFESTGRADEFFGLWVPGPDGRPVKRYYTVRDWRPDVGELDVEFVRHGDGIACAWAERAEPGDEVTFDAPRGHWAPPADTGRLVVAGDATALPAIARILAERAPTSPPADVLLTVDDPADRIDVPLLATDRLAWTAADELVGAFRTAVTDAGPQVFAWFSGEASAMRDARRAAARAARARAADHPLGDDGLLATGRGVVGTARPRRSGTRRRTRGPVRRALCRRRGAARPRRRPARRTRPLTTPREPPVTLGLGRQGRPCRHRPATAETLHGAPPPRYR